MKPRKEDTAQCISRSGVGANGMVRGVYKGETTLLCCDDTAKKNKQS